MLILFFFPKIDYRFERNDCFQLSNLGLCTCVLGAVDGTGRKSGRVAFFAHVNNGPMQRGKAQSTDLD